MSSNQLHTKTKQHDQGFTLLEVMMAICILTFGILAIASMQYAAMRGNHFAGGVTEGVTWGGDQLEKLVDLAWDDNLLQDADGDGTGGLGDMGFDNDDSTAGDADFQAVEGQYTIFWNVADDALTAGTKTISVIVTWSDHGDQKRVNFQRVVPREI
jgi:prepilin-type N-terminal cleavage/methylation domain-containing protein